MSNASCYGGYNEVRISGLEIRREVSVYAISTAMSEHAGQCHGELFQSAGALGYDP
jgi:hypothetical protein